jgi:hypothetical protein
LYERQSACGRSAKSKNQLWLLKEFVPRNLCHDISHLIGAFYDGDTALPTVNRNA